MSGIKGVGDGVVEAIIHEREKNGPFKSFHQFFKRINTNKVGKKAIESLVDAGCFDFTGWSRDALRQSIEPLFETVSKEQKEENAGVMSFFSLIGDTSEQRFAAPPVVKIETSKREILLKEKVLLGFFLTGHPLDGYKEVLHRLSCTPLRHLEDMDNHHVFRAAFIVEAVQIKISSKNQKKFAILTISDGMESYELPIWSEQFEEKQPLFTENQLLYAVLQVERREEAKQLSCRWIDDLTQIQDSHIEACDRAYDRAKALALKGGEFRKAPPVKTTISNPTNAPSKKLNLVFDAEKTHHTHILQVKNLFRKCQGKSTVQVDFNVNGTAIAAIQIASSWGIEITPELLKQLETIPVVQSVSIE